MNRVTRITISLERAVVTDDFASVRRICIDEFGPEEGAKFAAFIESDRHNEGSPWANWAINSHGSYARRRARAARLGAA